MVQAVRGIETINKENKYVISTSLSTSTNPFYSNATIATLMSNDGINGDLFDNSDANKTEVVSTSSSYRDTKTPPGPPGQIHTLTWCEET